MLKLAGELQLLPEARVGLAVEALPVRNLSATSSPSSASVARDTIDVPPRPISAMSS